MYKFAILMINNRKVLTLVVDQPTQILLNFCSIIRTKHLWTNQVDRTLLAYTVKELSLLKENYKLELVEHIVDQGFVYVDVTTGEIIQPLIVSRTQIIKEFYGALPF